MKRERGGWVFNQMPVDWIISDCESTGPSSRRATALICFA